MFEDPLPSMHTEDTHPVKRNRSPGLGVQTQIMRIISYMLKDRAC